MNLNLNLNSYLKSPNPLSLLHPTHHRSWRKRRVKTRITVSQFPDLVSWFPSLLFPAIGFASGGAAGYLSRIRDSEKGKDDVERVLFTSPTPFNRFVVLRCPSVLLQGDELLAEVNEKLVKEDRHFVRLDSGKVHVRDDDDVVEEKLVYQRICVSTDDGGVISLDWPANLELTEEHGLDTTLLLIPGSAQGSADKNVRSFVCESLRRGSFPVVMNPRGCAGSPLTTARLFTAADSDDISTAVQFINRARPWTTMTGVGWGYGANMLTKYLAEVGECTPLTAATCIDNPFDLEEATRSSPHHFVLDRMLTAGLVDILRSNQVLFRGRTKGFDVKKALVANSVRDFEKAISMRSYGYDTIEDFYENISTRRVVGKVKIPVLFIQFNDGGAPSFSIPRNSIADNPFTSLLMYSCSSGVFASGRQPALSWCHHLTIEWLAAVEVALLKGRHPLLEDVDVSLNPLKGLATVTSKAFNKRGKDNKLIEVSGSKSINEYGEYSLAKRGEEGDTSAGNNSKVTNPELKDQGLQQEGNGLIPQKKPEEAEKVEDEAMSENDRGQVLQATEVVMNMLDLTMPDTLAEEQKKKVLTAVGKGETIMKALQDVVPEDVRGNLQTAVSGFLQSEGGNLKLEKLLNISQIPTILGQKPKFQDHVEFTSAGEHEDLHIPDPKDRTDRAANNSSTEEVSTTEQKPKIQENGVRTGEHEKPHSTDPKETVDSDPAIDQNGGPAKLDLKEDETVANSTTDEPKIEPPTKEDHGLSATIPSPDAQTVEREDGANVNIEEKNVSVQSSTQAPGIEVSQALEALTGIDDSTQVAVNSIFGVLENAITQLEEGKDDETKGGNNNRKVLDNNEILGNEETKNKQSLQVDKLDKLPTHSETVVDKDARIRSENKERSIISPEHLNGSTISSSSNLVMIDHIVEEEDEKMPLVRSNALSQDLNKARHYYSAPLYINSKPYNNTLYKDYIRDYLLMKMQSTKALDINTPIDLSLNYIPEEGQMKLLEHRDATHKSFSNSPSLGDIDVVIEPSSVIMVSEEKNEPSIEYNTLNEANTSEELMILVKQIVFDVLKVEVGRRLSAANSVETDKLTSDMEEVASAASVAAGFSKNHRIFSDGNCLESEKIGILNGEEIVKAISFSIQETKYLRKVLPLGVIVGSSLASLRKCFDVASINGADQSETIAIGQTNLSTKRNHGLQVKVETYQGIPKELNHKCHDSITKDGKKDNVESESLHNGSVMIGAFTAALGVSALLANKEDPIKDDEKGDSHDPGKLDEEKNQNNLVTSLAEKAMSVASPIVPKKEDGALDQDRLVAMLSELGQRGGVLKLVGKIALLWGGMRGAMSLTDRLIQFLRIAERPLYQRILAFVFMVLLLWSPTVVPMLPSLVQSWGSRDPANFSQFVCIAGLYASVMILVVLWGKRIRGYENPIEQYGLNITSSPKIKNYLMGLIGGVLLVLSIHSVNAFLGCVHLSWPSGFLVNPADAVMWIKVNCKFLLLIGQGIITATSIALVEELLFRSWLPDEIAVDFGPIPGIIISGLAFALSQRSPLAIPGLWLLSLSLYGARQRSQGSLSVPIGLRAGIMTTSFVLQKGGFLTYKPNFPIWVTGAHPFQPFSDIVGLASTMLLAVFLYPNHPLHQENKKKEVGN